MFLQRAWMLLFLHHRPSYLGLVSIPRPHPLAAPTPPTADLLEVNETKRLGSLTQPETVLDEATTLLFLPQPFRVPGWWPGNHSVEDFGESGIVNFPAFQMITGLAA
jgi:hypothetical protein